MLLEPVQARLLEAPERFDFFQATYLLERFSGKKNLGEGACTQTEPVRFKASAQLGYRGAAIESISPAENPKDKASKYSAELEAPVKSVFEMTVSGFGILGAEGVMPLHYSEWVAAQARQGPSVLMAFIDLFHQRCLTLLYRAWKKYRFPTNSDSLVERMMKSVLGASPTSLPDQPYSLASAESVMKDVQRNRNASEAALLQYAGLMARGQVGGETLSRILSDYFNLLITIHEFQGGWEPISEAFLTRLPSRKAAPRRGRRQKNQGCLGMNAILGERAWQVQSKVLVCITCDSAEAFKDFSPNGQACEHLTTLLRHALGVGVSAELELVVQPAHLPKPLLPQRMGTLQTRASEQPASGLRLGRNCLLQGELEQTDAEGTPPLRVRRNLVLAA